MTRRRPAGTTPRPPRSSRTADCERGSVTLLVCCVAGLLLAATAAVLAVGSVLVARQRADSAADLAALAAARAAATPLAAPAGVAAPGCDIAARVAGAGGAKLLGCVTDGSGTYPTVSVLVEVPVPRVLAALDVPPARARARAGVPP